MKLNAEWHQKNRMPKNPTHEQRLDWHAAHAQHCGCREMPPALQEELRKRGRRGASPS